MWWATAVLFSVHGALHAPLHFSGVVLSQGATLLPPQGWAQDSSWPIRVHFLRNWCGHWWRESPSYQITNCEHYVRQESLKTCFHQMESEVINEKSKAEKREFISYSKYEHSHGPKHLPLHFLVLWPYKLTLLLSFFA